MQPDKTFSRQEHPDIPLPAKIQSATAGRALGGLLIRRERWGLSWPGRLLVGFLLLAGFLCLQHGIYPFLAVTHRVDGEILVVDGWAPPYTVKQAAEEYRKGKYQRVLVVRDVFDSSHATDLTWKSTDVVAQFLASNGVPADRIEKITTPVGQKDRTYHTALAVKNWLAQPGNSVKRFDLATVGSHARRSRLLYQKAFRGEAQVGIIALTGRTYDPAHWWRSSEGVRDILSETIGYLYARFLFSN